MPADHEWRAMLRMAEQWPPAFREQQLVGSPLAKARHLLGDASRSPAQKPQGGGAPTPRLQNCPTNART